MKPSKLAVCLCVLFAAVLAEQVLDENAENSELTLEDLQDELSWPSERDLTPSVAGVPTFETAGVPTSQTGKIKVKAAVKKRASALGDTGDQPGAEGAEGAAKTARCGKGKGKGRGKGKGWGKGK